MKLWLYLGVTTMIGGILFANVLLALIGFGIFCMWFEGE